jgi:hypothetical protein
MAKPSLKDPEKPMEYRPEKVTREFRPSVRLQERQVTLRQKLRIKDLAPDRKFIKDSSEKELRYFLLLTLPIVVTAFVTALEREDLVKRIIQFLISLLKN